MQISYSKILKNNNCIRTCNNNGVGCDLEAGQVSDLEMRSIGKTLPECPRGGILHSFGDCAFVGFFRLLQSCGMH